MGVMKRRYAKGERSRPIPGFNAMYRMSDDSPAAWHWAGAGPCPHFKFPGCERSPYWRENREAGSLRGPEPGGAARASGPGGRRVATEADLQLETASFGPPSHQPAPKQGPETDQAGGAARRQLTLWE